jgi:hypothetical protein
MQRLPHMQPKRCLICGAVFTLESRQNRDILARPYPTVAIHIF